MGLLGDVYELQFIGHIGGRVFNPRQQRNVVKGNFVNESFTSEIRKYPCNRIAARIIRASVKSVRD